MRKENDKPSVSSIYLDSKLPYAVEVAATLPGGLYNSMIRKFNDRIENTREHVIRFLDLMGA